jgi:hypothetical protein
MAVSAEWYGPPLLAAYSGTTVTWTSDTIKCALATSTYTPDPDAHDFFNDVTHEVSGTGYTAGGATLGTKPATVVGATNYVMLDAADVSWATASFTARYAVVYKSTGTPSTSPLLGYVDFGADQTVSTGTFTITWDATGVLKVSY